MWFLTAGGNFSRIHDGTSPLGNSRNTGAKWANLLVSPWALRFSAKVIAMFFKDSICCGTFFPGVSFQKTDPPVRASDSGTLGVIAVNQEAAWTPSLRKVMLACSIRIAMVRASIAFARFYVSRSCTVKSTTGFPSGTLYSNPSPSPSRPVF